MSGPRSGRRPTIRDVAALAGVSVASVSNVLGGRDDQTSPATRQRIDAAIAELGFVPSPSARQLRGQGARSLGLIVHSLLNPSTVLFVRGAEHAALAHGHSLLLTDLDREAAATPAHLDALLVGKVDGVIVTSYTAPDVELAARLRQRGTPAVAITSGAPSADGVPAVGIDNETGMRAIVEHLIGLGHRRIAFVVHSRASLHSDARLAVFRREMRRHRLVLPDELVVAVDVAEIALTHDYDIQAGRTAAATLFALPERPTAIVAAYDMIAFGVIAQARVLGWEIPGDLAVTGFDDVPFASVSYPTLTTARVPMYQIGRAAVEMLLASLAGEVPLPSVFAPELVIRGSSAARASSAGG